jgi:hypothetical protein
MGAEVTRLVQTRSVDVHSTVLLRVIQPSPAADWIRSLVLRDQTGTGPEDVALPVRVVLPGLDRRCDGGCFFQFSVGED